MSMSNTNFQKKKLFVHNWRRKKEKRKTETSHQDYTQDLQKTRDWEIHEYGLLRKLPFCSLMKIKTGLWYASTDRRKRPLHICAEIKWSSSMELEKSAVFKEQLGEERADLLLTLSPAQCLYWMALNAAVDLRRRGRWSRCSLQTGATCTAHIDQWSRSTPVGSSDQCSLRWGWAKRDIPSHHEKVYWPGISRYISSQHWGRWMAWIVRLLLWPAKMVCCFHSAILKAAEEVGKSKLLLWKVMNALVLFTSLRQDLLGVNLQVNAAEMCLKTCMI